MTAPSITKTGNNSTTVHTGNVQLFFSYETVIAFHHTNTGLVVCENVWGVTTGKHLNAIDGGSAQAKRERKPRAEFLKLLAQVS